MVFSNEIGRLVEDCPSTWSHKENDAEESAEPVISVIDTANGQLTVHVISDLMQETSGTLEVILYDFTNIENSSQPADDKVSKNLITQACKINMEDLVMGKDLKSIYLMAVIKDYSGITYKNRFDFVCPKDLMHR